MENVGEKWHREMAERVGEAVATWRRTRGLTAQELADRCKALDAPIHRTTITKIENGRPRFDLGELMILAAALNVPPIVLLYPGPDYGKAIDVLPSVQDREIDAVQWFSGVRDHGYSDATGAEQARARADFKDSILRLQLWRELLDVQRKISSVVVPARRVEGEVVVGKLTDVQVAQLELWQDQVQFLRERLGLEFETDDGG